MNHKKPLPIFLVILLDILGIGAMLGVFYLFAFVLKTDATQPLRTIFLEATATPAASTVTPEPNVTETPAITPQPTPTPTPSPTPAPGDFSATFPTGALNTEGALGSYADDNLRIVVTQHRTDTAVYYIADVWVRNILGFKTAFAGGSYPGGYALPSEMASDNNAILALSGDCNRARPEGLVIRNGTLYRDSIAGDICILYGDGVMESYYESDFDLDAAIARGAYQSWSFGPKLIDNGQVPSSYNTTNAIIAHNPRAALGYFEPGHYCLVYADGRQGETSNGLTLDELSQIMISLGCVDAYNLDGGQSSMMIFQGEVIGNPYKGGRNISDIIYFGGDDPQ